MNKRILSILTTLFLLLGMSVAQAGVDNLRRGSKEPRVGASQLVASRTPEWAPKLISESVFPTLSSGVTVLEQAQNQFNPMNAITSPSGATIYGYRALSTDPSFVKGWYELTTDGRQELLWTNEALIETVGFVRNGEYYCFYSLDFYGAIYVNWSVYDIYTGELLRQGDLDNSDYSQMVLSVVYDEWEDVAYAYTYNSGMTGAMIQRIDLETMQFTTIRNDEYVVTERVATWAYNPIDHNIYGINLSGEFVLFDKEFGTLTYVGNTGLIPGSFSQSMVYSPLDRKYVWAAILPDQTSCVFTVDPETGVATSTYRFDYPNQYTVLWTPDQLCADNAPGLATFKSLEFEGASQKGKGVVTLPTVNYIGEPISGEVLLKIADGRTIIHSELKGQAGEDVEFDLSLSEGLHNISAVPYLKIDGANVEGHPVYKEVYIGYDTPKAPQNIVLTQTQVRWDAVGEVGENGGYVDVSDLTYNIYINGEKQNETPITTNSFDITIPDSTLAYYTAEVEAISKGKTSEKGSSKAELFGRAFSVPYYAQPTADDFALFTTVDNGYGYWKYAEGDDEPLYHICHAEEPADDWIFLPLIKFDDTEHLYEFSFDARVRLKDYGNILQMGISKTTNPADAEIFHTESFNNTEYMTFSKMFNVEEAGEYHLAIRCASVSDGFYLYLKDINVKATDNLPQCPDICENLKVKPALKGELKATVEFSMPRRTVAGGSLYVVNEELTATIKSDVETKTVTGKPGSRQSVEIATPQGMNAIYVMVANSYGNGEEARAMVYTGEDVPKYTDIEIDASADNLSGIVTWEAPKTGVNGGYLNPANLVYRIYNNHPLTGEWIELGNVKGETTYTVTLPEGANQQLLKIGITVENEYGGGKELSYNTIVLGPPFELPVVEEFAGVVSYEPIAIQALGPDYSGQWTFYNPADIDPAAINQTGLAVIGYPSSQSASIGRLALPKFTTLGSSKAELKMRFFVEDFTPDTDILLCGNFDDEVVLGTVTAADGEGWITKTYTFPEEFQNRKWAYIALRANYNGSIQYLIMDSYSIKEPKAQDVAMISLEGDKSMMVGDTKYYDVKIENNGYETIAVPDVVCQLMSTDGQVIKNLEASDIPMQTELSPAEQVSLQFEFIPTVDTVGEYIIRASFDNGDMITDNNSCELPINVKLGTDPVVTDLEASFAEGGNKVQLTWSAPVLSFGVEDFEDMTAFSYDENLGDWINIDGDGKSIWIFSSWVFPDMGLPKGFQVFDYTQLPISDSLFEAYSGDKYIVTMSPDDMVTNADDWLISPEINGGSTVSFMYGIINQLYSPEYVEVLYSSTTRDREAFKLVETFSKSTLGWELITSKLPEDAKYFAIHYISKNTFGIMIDDIIYSPVGQDVEIVGYNIYRDGKMIAEKVAEPRYIDENLEVKDYVYNVTVVVNKDGEEIEYPMSNNAYANLLSVEEVASDNAIYTNDGCIVLSGFAGKEYGVYTIDGICVASKIAESDIERIKVAPNVYVVMVGTRVEKIILK